MGQITSGIGLVSGINSKDIIDQLIALESRPKVNLLTRIDTENKKKLAFTDIQTRLTNVRLFGTSIKKPQTFRAADVKSTDENVVTGTASSGAAAGSYRMSVARLVTSQQAVSRGFADFNSTPVGAGTMTLELGGGEINTPTRLEELNGGDGIRRGQFRIQDRSGKSTVIDATDAVTLDDIIKKINTSLDVNVKAQIKNDTIVLTDQSGQFASNLRVEEVGDGHTAEDLGILQNVGANSITGTRLARLKPGTALDKLNDGRGVGLNNGQPDFRVTMGDGTEFDVSLTGAKTIGDVITQINSVIGGKGYADFTSDGKGIRVADYSIDYNDPDNPPASTISIAALNGSTAAKDLGIEGTGTTGGFIDGSGVIAGINTTLVNSLRGGRGLTLGTIRIQDRSGTTSDINLAGANTVEEILTRINDANVNVLAEVKPGGNGITLTDKTNRLGQLVITDQSGEAAAQLGIAGSFDPTTKNTTINGANLQKAWFNSDTLLRDLNGGKGVPDGKFRITDSAGKTRTITVDGTKDTSVSDLIAKINAGTGFGVKAGINENGDGLLLTDSAGGSLKMKVEELDNGTVAKSLNVVGTAAATTINGSWEKTITISATDKLQDVSKKIQDLNWGLSPAIINDGSGEKPYRLSLTSVSTGRAGRVVFDSGAVNLGERVLVDAQDAAVFVGSDNGAQPMLITSNSNQITGAIRGVTLNLNGVSKEPVTVNVARNVDNVVESANKFVEDFNGLLTQLKTYTKFDSATNTRGELLGDTTAQSVETELFGMINTVGNKDGKYRIPADVGFRVGTGGVLEFDEQKFRAAYADDPEAVTTLFTRGGVALDEDYQVQNLRLGKGLRTTETGPDFRVSVKDGSTFDVDVSELSTMGQILDAINSASGNAGRVVASINSTGNAIELTDKTTAGNKKLIVTALNGSIAASDLGLMNTSVNGKISGRRLIDANAGNDGGIGTLIEKRANRLIDPTSGIVTRASKAVDDRSDAFTSRIESIDRLIATKRARLEKQFAGLETSLSSLQGQQQALNSFSSIPAAG
jgi:flagellar hook-associated protein 2